MYAYAQTRKEKKKAVVVGLIKPSFWLLLGALLNVNEITYAFCTDICDVSFHLQ